MANRLLAFVRGSGDIGSAGAHALLRAGHATLIHDQPAPTVTRRGMVFTDALFDGASWLAEIEGRRVNVIEPLSDVLGERRVLPLTSLDLTVLLS